MSTFFAFLHHLAAFGLVATLAVQRVLLGGELTVKNARKLQVADAVYGACAGILLVVGLLRVVYFEKGADYYFHSVPFVAKLSLFVAAGLLSIYPTVTFRGWAKALKLGQPPTVAAEKVQLMRKVIHWQLLSIVLILLCAALMARGIGFLG
jgi:putative membrane protein